MSFLKAKRCAPILFFTLCCTFPVWSQIFEPQMPDPLKRKASMNMDWHFFKGTPSGTPSAAGYNDSGVGWNKVNVPHSASYDAAPRGADSYSSFASETNYYKGNCWYRKTFGVPASAKKLFIEFEGAMQTATVYVNGTQVGQHINSGYTSFYYDITNRIIRGSNNVVAVMLNNDANADIPPGTVYPDYFLFSGLYRSVWLHSKDSVYIPVYSQHIQTVNVSAASAQIRAVTPVKNDALTAKSVQVTLTLFDATHTGVVSQSSTLSIPAGVLDTFDMTTAALSNPHLWSPSSPYIYSAQTIVSVGSQVVDSVVEPCGVRWITWAAGSSGSFNLNGSRYEIRGMCVHQFEGWIENAVPDSRYWQEIKLLKNMGCNSIRCSHYPRAQAFYDACDRQGMLVYVEQPSWGWDNIISATAWTRMDSCIKEMVLSGRNHPCIYLWGLYNEPYAGGDFTSQITVMNNTAHSLDPTRYTAMANIPTFNAAATVPDVEGLNYTLTGTSGAYRWVGTESSDDFYRLEIRGSLVDLDTSSNSYYQREWNSMYYSLATSGQLSGGHFWCFKDYNSPIANATGNQGIVDRLTVPKTVFYKFRKMWTGAAMDLPTAGITATTIQLLSDTTVLRANGADVFLLTANLRNASGVQSCADSGNVTFSVSPAASGTIFGGNVAQAYAGRAGALLRTTTVPAGPLTVTAAYGSLPVATLTLTTLQDTNQTPLFSPTAVMATTSRHGDAVNLKILSTSKGVLFLCPPVQGRLTVINCQGRTVYSSYVKNGASMFVDRRTLGTGIFYGVWESGGRRAVSRLDVVY
jgi:beta-galactosidase